MIVDYRYELNNIEIGIRFYPVDGAQVVVTEYTDDFSWKTLYDMRVIAEDLREYVTTGLYGAGLSDEDVEDFIFNYEYELENGVSA